MNQAIGKTELGAFAFLGGVTILSVLAAFNTGQYYLALIPFGLLIAYMALINFKALYYFLLFTLPLSIEYSFSDTLATDLPDEPLMIGMMVVTLLFMLTSYRSLPTGFFANILMAALGLHIFWIFLSATVSIDGMVSAKVFLAKLWYLFTFCFLTAMVVKTKEDLKRAFWCMFIPLTIEIIIIIIRHGMQGFSFEDINKPMMPFFRNHVNYAAMLSIMFPFILWARQQYPAGSFTKRLLSASVLFYVVAIYLSYTRTCYLALALLPPVYFVIKHRLMKPAMGFAIIGITAVMVFLFTDNRYLKFAPEFQDTIIHDQFGEHLSSTFEGKDVSSMERVYRWVAAVRMFQDHPYMGFGPGNFHPYYKRYTVTSFETYVSDNPERSTAHNYSLLLLTEQGGIGLGIFLLLTVVIFIYGEGIYHRAKTIEDKRTAMMLLLMLAMVYVNLTLSDMLETDKVGPFFFIAIALLVAQDIRNRQEAKAIAH